MDADRRNYESWKIKRRNTFIIFTLEELIDGMEVSGSYGALLVYLTVGINLKNHTYVYVLISLMKFLPAIIISPYLARVVDKTRRVKIWIIVANYLVMIGAIFYAMSW